ncbi:MAG: efflux RND transporter permease subunit [Candidatus Latescibacterota bacterium]|nr:MAG: efflux RND transporter permease subunit [Candidatus Latescibacterota bacterium]
MTPASEPTRSALLQRVVGFCLDQKLIVALLVVLGVIWGLLVAPFDWDLGGLPRNPVPVDAIPDIGENQQIVFSEWPGRSPQDVEDQITYPLTTALLGVPGVKTIRSYSYFGFSSIYVVFEEEIEFYWSRSRVLEKLSSLPAGTLPDGVSPALGPDATALGQIFWYTLEGRDANGDPTGGWDLHELRSIQDWYVRYALQSAAGVSEVASVGGFVREYQIDVDPDAMRAHGVRLEDVFQAVRMSNVDVGARTIEVNRVEYVIRGRGFLRSIEDIEKTVVRVSDNVPISVKDVARVGLGPALRRGALDKGGAEAVGGVVVVRYGANPLEVIQNVKEKIAEISPGLPSRVLEDGTVSQVTLVPFYDRTGLIHETLGTLSSALSEEILVTIIVVLVMLLHLRSSLLISGLLPLAVLLTFIAMKWFGVDANIVALSGIAIAIGTIVDTGIVITENIVRHLESARPDESRRDVIVRATSEVGGAVLTAISTTVVSFLPVFAMEAAEGKLFKPLAYTKTFALLASIVVALTVIPPAAQLLFTRRLSVRGLRQAFGALLMLAGVVMIARFSTWGGVALVAAGLFEIVAELATRRFGARVSSAGKVLAILFVGFLLTEHWLPLGPGRGLPRNLLFVTLLLGFWLVGFLLFQRAYLRILDRCLAHKTRFLLLPVALVLFGATIWLGFERVFGVLPAGLDLVRLGEPLRRSGPWAAAAHAFPGLGKEFMPSLDEGSFLFMPTTMPHASIGEALDVLQKQDMALAAIPEVEAVVGKIGRVDSPLDPAPVSMIETVIQYKPEYRLDAKGRRARFRYEDGEFVRDAHDKLVPDPHGRPYREWRDEIRSPDDIWEAIVTATRIPGTTSAPKLQPIAARLVMLQSGMRAPMGVKVRGPDLESVEEVGLEIERLLKQVPGVEAQTVIADRIVGKPYLEIHIDREAIARYGISVRQLQDVIEIAIGGRRLTTTVEGRERYPVRVRYQRELRDQIETLGRILVPASSGAQIPLTQLAEIRYVRGPQVIKSEDTFLTGYVIFDKRPGWAEVDVVRECQAHLARSIDSGTLQLPGGVSFAFAGSYENQVRSEKKLMLVLPLALFIIFLILYFQFRNVATTLMVFSGVFVAWSGGFLLVWLYGQGWFLDVDLFGTNLRDLFQVRPVNLSVAVWVGFLALFGIATDDGVIMATYIRQLFARRQPRTVAELRAATLEAGRRRIRPALMTAATTTLALIPVLTSTGRGADIMVPMAIPSFGGMLIVLVTLFVVPTLYCGWAELQLRRREPVAVGTQQGVAPPEDTG